jgi:hypothetical protein
MSKEQSQGIAALRQSDKQATDDVHRLAIAALFPFSLVSFQLP